jgi:hypothetical protein
MRSYFTVLPVFSGGQNFVVLRNLFPLTDYQLVVSCSIRFMVTIIVLIVIIVISLLPNVTLSTFLNCE